MVKIDKLKVKDSFQFTRQVFKDKRGSFDAWWEYEDFKNLPFSFKPDNSCHSYNHKAHTLRGIHYQKTPYSQSKLVTCVSGKARDVIVDLRPDSPTYLLWDSVELSSESGISVFVPKGCAHGFITLENNTTIAYLIEGEYQADAGGVLRWDDPLIGIDWPTLNPILSEKDRQAPYYKL